MSGAVPRILALLAAVGMVVGALAVRNRMDDDEVTRSTELRLTCTPELEEACRSLAGTDDATIVLTIEEAGVTVDRLRAGTGADLDGWLTPGPFPQMVQELRRLGGLSETIADVSAPIARSRIGLAAYQERAKRLACRGGVSWRCLGDVAGQPWSSVGGQPEWGPVKTAFPDPTRTATGLLALGAATAGFFGRADISSIDLDDNDEFGVWLDRLRRADQPVDLGRMLSIGPAAVDLLAGLEQAMAPAVAASARRSEATVIYPSPVANADVVIGTPDTDRGRRLAELVAAGPLRDDLVEQGWKRPAGGATGLPSPGLLSVLRDRWAQ